MDSARSPASAGTGWRPTTLDLTVHGVAVRVAGLERDGHAGTGTGTAAVRTPIVFLHGFGSTKEDYADVALHPTLGRHPALAYDAPGCGATTCADLAAVDVPFLLATAEAVIERAGFERVHLVGHSMGGLTALLYAHAHPEKVASFASIEGNLAPEDCFLSRQALTHPEPTPEAFQRAFMARLVTSRFYSANLFAAALPVKARAEVMAPIFTSMVEFSDHAPLLDRFLALPAPRMLMYGDQNAGLSYLPRLRAAEGVELAEIPACGHFPMYANAPEMWRRLASFVGAAEVAGAGE